MPPLILEHKFTCPYCWEEISMLLDLSVEDQSYVEDCEICCHPIHLRFHSQSGDLTRFEARQVDW
jgi:transcription elongation factor Elf1